MKMNDLDKVNKIVDFIKIDQKMVDVLSGLKNGYLTYYEFGEQAHQFYYNTELHDIIIQYYKDQIEKNKKTLRDLGVEMD